MFAILMSEDTLPKILEVDALTDKDVAFLKTCCTKQRYFIRGYVSRRGALIPWTILPSYLFTPIFEHDEIKIQTDWDLIVRMQ